MRDNTTPPVDDPTGDEVPDGTQLPTYHPSVAEACAQADAEQGDAGVPDPEPFEED